MKNTRRLGAFTSGLALYCLAIGLSTLLADLRLPREVYGLLGGRHSLSVIVGEALAIAVPVFAFALAWAYLSLRPLRLGRRLAMRCYLGGLALAWLGWLIYGAVYFDRYPRTANLPISGLLLSSVIPPVWGLFNTLAVLAATLLAGSQLRRRPPAPPGHGLRPAR